MSALGLVGRRQILATGALLASVSAPPLRASWERPLRLGFAGVGNRGETNLLAMKHESIVAVCDVDERHLERSKSVAPSARRYRDFRELIRHENGLDGVVISSPDHTHAVFALAAMRRGLHVYCEKPLAHNLRELRVLARAALKHKVVCQVGVQHHSKPGYQRVVEVLKSGCLGAIQSVHAWTNRPIWAQGKPLTLTSKKPPAHLNFKLWLGPAPEVQFHPDMHPLGWRGWWDFGGGAITDMGAHLLDPLVSGLSLEAPTRIRAQHPPCPQHGPPSWSEVEFEFPPTPSRQKFSLKWYDGYRRPNARVTGFRRLPPNGVMVLGDAGRLFWPDLGKKPTLLPPLRSSKKAPNPETNLKTGSSHHQNWLNAIRQKEPVRTDFTYGATLCSIGCLGNLAIRSQSAIEWDASTWKVTDPSSANRWVSRTYRSDWSID